MDARRWTLLGAACALSLAAPGAAAATSRVAVGEVVQTAQLETLDGPQARGSSRESGASVLVFFRPGHDYSLELLQQLAQCTQDLAGKAVRFAAVVSSTWPVEQVRESVAAAGARMPVFVDAGDELYGRLGIQVHPAIVVLDEHQRFVAQEPWRKVNFCDRVRSKIRFALHEIDDAEVRRTEDPFPAATRVRPTVVMEQVVSAPRFFLGTDRFEDEAGTPPASGAAGAQAVH
jgi:hypothetical protein